MDNDQNAPQDPTAGTTHVQSPAADSPAPSAQPEGTTLDTRPQAGPRFDLGESIAAAGKDGSVVHAVLLPHADVSRLTELAQQVHHFVANEGAPIVKELMLIAADVRQYL
jgi:hypothetical protein